MADNRANRELMTCKECGAATVIQWSADGHAGDHTCRRCDAENLQRIEDPLAEE